MCDSDSDESISSERSSHRQPGRSSKLKQVAGKHEVPAELFRKDLISAMKLSDAECLLPEEYIVITDQWRQDWERGVQVPVNPDVVVPSDVVLLKENENMNGSYAFKMPKKLLHETADEAYKQSAHELHETYKLAEEVCRYDLDQVDESWLKLYNETRELCGLEELSGWWMEKTIEELENRCYAGLKAAEAEGMEYDEDTVCDVCRMPEVEEGNEMVFCDGCDVGVHQACYGILKIPKGSWVCRTCAVGLKPRCALCTTIGGAMKNTKDGTQWAHLSCAIWVPEVIIECSEKMEPVDNIDLIPMTRWNLICCVCRERSGACIQCSVKKCKTAFHVTCAFQKNYDMKMSYEDGSTELQFKAFCDEHSQREPRLSTGTPKKSNFDATEEEKKSAEKSRMQKIRDEFYKYVTPKEVADVLGLDKETVSFIFEYWKLKRKCNFGQALLTAKVEEGAILMRQREDSLVARLRMFIHLRQDLERVRNLCYMVLKRERTRSQLHQVKKDMFLKQVEALKSKPGSREEEIIRRLHKQRRSIYERPLEVERVSKKYESRLNKESKNDSDEDETYRCNYITVASPLKDQEPVLKSSKSGQKSKVKASVSLPMIATPSNPKTQPSPASKSKKRAISIDPAENPYARPTYKSFSWILGTRKRRKIDEKENDEGGVILPTSSVSDTLCSPSSTGGNVHRGDSSLKADLLKMTCDGATEVVNVAGSGTNEEGIQDGMLPSHSVSNQGLDAKLFQSHEKLRNKFKPKPKNVTPATKKPPSGLKRGRPRLKSLDKSKLGDGAACASQSCNEIATEIESLVLPNSSTATAIESETFLSTLDDDKTTSFKSSSPGSDKCNNLTNQPAEIPEKKEQPKVFKGFLSIGRHPNPVNGNFFNNCYPLDSLCMDFVSSKTSVGELAVSSPRKNDPASSLHDVKKKTHQASVKSYFDNNTSPSSAQSGKLGSPPAKQPLSEKLNLSICDDAANNISTVSSPPSPVSRSLSKMKLLRSNKNPASGLQSDFDTSTDPILLATSSEAYQSPPNAKKIQQELILSPEILVNRKDIEEVKSASKKIINNKLQTPPPSAQLNSSFREISDSDAEDFVSPVRFKKPPVKNGVMKKNKRTANHTKRILNKKIEIPVLKSIQGTLDKYLKFKSEITPCQTSGDDDKSLNEKVNKNLSLEGSVANGVFNKAGDVTFNKQNSVISNEKLGEMTARIILKLDRLVDEKLSQSLSSKKCLFTDSARSRTNVLEDQNMPTAESKHDEILVPKLSLVDDTNKKSAKKKKMRREDSREKYLTRQSSSGKN